MTALVIHGSEGRMGRRLMALAEEHGFELLGGIDQDTELSVCWNPCCLEPIS